MRLVKTVFGVLYFELFVNIFILIRENKSKKENGLTYKALHHVDLMQHSFPGPKTYQICLSL
jgi:hypothetical protein